MEAKPIITCDGNKTLFSSLHAAVVTGLPKEVCQWKRSFGRAPRSVQLEGSFVPYDADILPEEDTKTLVSRPYFHIFWTDCDLDSYKQSVRDEIAEWQAALKARNIPDWLIVVVIPDESKVKAKLLPRSSVIDKVRNDFCSKQPERSIVLTEPLKSEAKSSESWSQFFGKLRGLLLQAYNRHLNKYEENMRSLREKRNEAGWSYFDYFAVQEELGFMLEVLGLREDALIQYDELDAMFDQFVENHASGDAVKWLSPLLKPCTSWAGLSLAKPIDLDLRDNVKHTTVSLLEFRNYLFCRQAALLFAMGRAWEVAERAFEFLRNTVIEMKSLEVELPEGALQCWVVLSGMEVLAACQQHKTGQVDRCSIFTAHLWDHIRGKLKELGQLCSLLPGMVPSSAQLNQVLDLKSGMALSHQQETACEIRPVDTLHEALSSPEAFKKHYLEMCELAIGTYKHISRFRSARMVGRELADFYMKIGEPQKAEAFLLDAVKMYRMEGWFSLAYATMRDLASCQKQMGHVKRFVVTSSKVACSDYLPLADRCLYFDQMMQELDTITGMPLEGQELVQVERLHLSRGTVKVGERVCLGVQLHSRFPRPLTCRQVQLAFSPAVDKLSEQTDISSDAKPVWNEWESQTVVIDNAKPAPSRALRRVFPSVVPARVLHARRQGQVVVAGIDVDNAHDLLKRADSTPLAAEASGVMVKGDYDTAFSCGGLELKPGLNELELTMQAGEEGWLVPSQLCVSVAGLDMLVPVSTTTGLKLHVACYPATFTLAPKHSDQFIVGITQAATLTFSTGSQCIKPSSGVSLTSSLPVIFSPVGGQGEGRECLKLGAQEPHTSVEMDLSVFVPWDAAAAASAAADQDSITTDVICHVDALTEHITGQIAFAFPLCAVHRIYTARDKKYLQIKLVNKTLVPVSITEPEMSGRGAAFTFLNPAADWVVRRHQDLSLVWEVNVKGDDSDAEVSVNFSCSFICDLDLSRESRKFSYSCALRQFETLYLVDYNLSGESTVTAPIPGTQLSSKSIRCAGYQSGITYSFYLSVTPVGPHCGTAPPGQLLYRVTADPAVWAFAGKVTGVFTIADKPFRASLKAIPLAAGYQHLPKVTLYQHQEKKEASPPKSDDIWSRRAQAESTTREEEEAESPPPGEGEDLPFADGVEEEETENNKEEEKEETKSDDEDLSDFVELVEGQVYNASATRQVHVFPTPASSDMEVSMIS